MSEKTFGDWLESEITDNSEREINCTKKLELLKEKIFNTDSLLSNYTKKQIQKCHKKGENPCEIALKPTKFWMPFHSDVALLRDINNCFRRYNCSMKSKLEKLDQHLPSYFHLTHRDFV